MQRRQGPGTLADIGGVAAGRKKVDRPEQGDAALGPSYGGWLWLLWLLSQPPENGGPGFDPISARKLTLEAAMFYLTAENHTKRRCAAENKRSEPDDGSAGKTKAELLKERMTALRLKFTGSADPYAEPEAAQSDPQAPDEPDFEAEN